MYMNGTETKRMMQMCKNERMGRWTTVLWIGREKGPTAASMIEIEGDVLCAVNALKMTC